VLFSGSGDCAVVSWVCFDPGSSRRENVRSKASGATGCAAKAGFWMSKIVAHLAHLIFF
jgi:hypothetical protein